MQSNSTVVINCAGMGNRLGFGMPKALLRFGGKSILEWHLQELSWHSDVRVVVGFCAEDVIKNALKIRRDIVFVTNYQYRETGTMSSLALGAKWGAKTIISVDGDLLIPPSVLTKFCCQRSAAVIGITSTNTEEGIKVKLSQTNNIQKVMSFVKKGDMEWSGLLKVPVEFILDKNNIARGQSHIFQVIKKRLPITATKVNCFEIDTPQDYQQALLWAKDYML